jgi:4-hydroxybenzoate polyprenyltransferase
MTLFVDFDGTLHRSDLLLEQLVRLLPRKPWLLPRLLWTLLRQGKSGLKAAVAAQVPAHGIQLPWNEEVLEFVRDAGRQGEVIILTAGDEKAVQSVIRQRSDDWRVVGSHETANLKGPTKAKCLRELGQGMEGTHYVGDSSADIPVWAASTHASFVGPHRRRHIYERSSGKNFVRHFVLENNTWTEFLRALRPHQWLKNLLVFLPLLAGHAWFDAEVWQASIRAFVGFCMAASSVYLFNDLLDLDADRLHPRKKTRPIAQGSISIPHAFALACLLGFAAFLIGPFTWPYQLCLLVYLVASAFYSLSAKKVLALDIVVLAFLYTLRIVAGGLATDIEPSSWLLMFSGFFFFSLAAGKRYAELVHLGESITVGRAYGPAHRTPLAAFGIASGMTAILILALYTKDMNLGLYSHPELLLLGCPILAFWFCRFWLRAASGQGDYDPVIDAAKDPVTWLCLLAIISVAYSAL